MWRAGVAAVLCVLAATGVVLAAPGYSIAPVDSVGVPERTVDLQGTTYTVDTTARVRPNGTATVDVTAPDEVYRLYLYDSDERIVASKRGEGNETFSVDLDGFEPGSYLVSAYARDSGKHEAIEPLLISAYTLTLDSPDSVAPDSGFGVAVGVTRVAADRDPALVRVVLANGTETTTVTATRDGERYVANVRPETLTAGDYRVYALAQSETEAFGRKELVGLSDPQVLTVGPPETEGTEAAPTATNATTTRPATADSGRTDTGTEAASGARKNQVLTPNATPSSTRPPGTAGHGFTPLGVVLAGLVAFGIARVRHRV